jgi:hypothetical protein
VHVNSSVHGFSGKDQSVDSSTFGFLRLRAGTGWCGERMQSHLNFGAEFAGNLNPLYLSTKRQLNMISRKAARGVKKCFLMDSHSFGAG